MSERSILIQLIQGTFSKLTLLDFSPLGLQFIDVRSKAFKVLLKSIPNQQHPKEYHDVFVETFKDFLKVDEKLYVLCPLDLTSLPALDDYVLGFNYLLVISPSLIQPLGQMEFYHAGGSIQWQMRKFRYEPDQYFFVDKSDFKEINRFLPKFIEHIRGNKYIQIALENFVFSFVANFDHLALLSLTISFETILDGKEELNFRLKRNLAILCGYSASMGERIFENVGEIYKLRSAIVHGANYKPDLVEHYLPYARTLSACMIIELIIHCCTDIENFNKQCAKIGFGDHLKLIGNTDIIHFKYSQRSHGLRTLLPKFKTS